MTANASQYIPPCCSQSRLAKRRVELLPRGYSLRYTTVHTFRQLGLHARDAGCGEPCHRIGSSRVRAMVRRPKLTLLLLEQFQPLSAEQLKAAALLGRCVVIGGVQSRPELNGRHGNPIYYIAKSKRYSVVLDGCGAELLSLKPNNLTALPHGDYGNFMLHAPAQRSY